MHYKSSASILQTLRDPLVPVKQSVMSRYLKSSFCAGCPNKVTEFQTEKTLEIFGLENQFCYVWIAEIFHFWLDKNDRLTFEDGSQLNNSPRSYLGIFQRKVLELMR